MIYVILGTDTYTKAMFISNFRASIVPPDLSDANITSVNGQDLPLNRMMEICNVVPFLAERRLVIVDGLLDSLRNKTKPRSGVKSKSTVNQTPNVVTMVECMESISPTTDLILRENQTDSADPFVKSMEHLADIREFHPPTGQALIKWIADYTTNIGGAITTPAANLLADMLGPDLWSLSNEIDKLCLYTTGESVADHHVRELVSSVQDVNIFAVIDSILGDDGLNAIRLIQPILLRTEGSSYILSMLGRQMRLLLITKDLLSRNLGREQISKRLGIQASYPLRKTIDQARSSDPTKLSKIHDALLETDWLIKRGMMDGSLAIELLIAKINKTTRPHPLTVSGPGPHSLA